MAAAAVSGILLGLSFPPFPFPYFAWFAFVPLLLGWNGTSDGRRAFLDAYLALLMTFAVAFQWPLFHEMTATALLSLPPLLVIPMWMAAPFGIAHMVCRRFGLPLALCVWVALMILAEYGLRAGPLAFPWTLVGYSQAPVSSIRGLAALGGVQFLSLVVLMVNAALVFGLRRSAGAASILAGPAILIAALIGSSAASPEAIDVPHPRTRVAGIQPSLSPRVWADLDDSSRVPLLLRLSEVASAADSTIDLIIWPETSIPPRPATRTYLNRIQSLVDSTRIPILAGAIITESADSTYRNAAVLSAPRRPVSVYHKIRLVPFAEQVPFARTIPFLRHLAIPAGGVAGYEPGENRTIFEIPDLRFGVLICFETLFGGASRTYAREGADALVTITQDGWWGDSFGYRQHLEFNRLRAVETGLPMVQVAATGISALIHPDGRIEKTAGWMEKSIWSVDMPPPSTRTPYVRWGDWVSVLAAIVALAIFSYGAVRWRMLNRNR